jgi:hypothetical protein
MTALLSISQQQAIRKPDISSSDLQDSVQIAFRGESYEHAGISWRRIP